MKKIINGRRIEFYDGEKLVMYIDYSTDECIWYFNSGDVIKVAKDMELFEPLKSIMSQQYQFNDDEILKSYKSYDKLVWYSDCYYNPDDEMSRNSVIFLTIEYEDEVFKLKCQRPLDDIIGMSNKSYAVIFSPLGNGTHSRNIKSGLTLQDDFVINVYQKLLGKNKVKRLQGRRIQI